MRSFKSIDLSLNSFKLQLLVIYNRIRVRQLLSKEVDLVELCLDFRLCI
jgi:hypothetical protein